MNVTNFTARIALKKACLFLSAKNHGLLKFVVASAILWVPAVPPAQGQFSTPNLTKPVRLSDSNFCLSRLGSPSARAGEFAPFSTPVPKPIPSLKDAFKSSVVRFGHDQKNLYSTPFRRSNLKWDALFLAGTAGLVATDKRAIGAIDSSHIHLSNHISDAGLYGGAATVGAIWLTGIATHNEHAREAGVLTAEAVGNIIPVYIGLQLLTGRERPDEGLGHGRFEQNNGLGSSFPSGHAIVSWGIAAVIAREYPKGWVKWVAYGAATAVSVTRFTGRDHFPSDVVVGSALGYLIGRQIFRHHCDQSFSESCHD